MKRFFFFSFYIFSLFEFTYWKVHKGWFIGLGMVGLDGVLRYQEEELLSSLTHVSVLPFFFFPFLILLGLSPSSLCRLCFHFLFFSFSLSLSSLHHVFQNRKRDGWDQIRALAKKVFSGCLFVVVLAFLGLSFLLFLSVLFLFHLFFFFFFFTCL